MADGEDLYAFVLDPVKDAVDSVTLAVEQLAHTFLAKGGLGGQGASLGELHEALDGIAQPVEPFHRHAPSQFVKIPLSPVVSEKCVDVSISPSTVEILVDL